MRRRGFFATMGAMLAGLGFGRQVEAAPAAQTADRVQAIVDALKRDLAASRLDSILALSFDPRTAGFPYALEATLQRAAVSPTTSPLLDAYLTYLSQPVWVADRVKRTLARHVDTQSFHPDRINDPELQEGFASWLLGSYVPSP